MLLGLLFVMSQGLNAQAKLKLSLMPDQETYLVSMIPEVTWQMPLNIVGSAQVVLQVEADRPFSAGEITSMIPGISWIDNAYVESPASAPAYNFVCFVLNEQGTREIPFEDGVETPLFTFKNIEPGCVGMIELVDNTDLRTKKIAYKDQLNITQNLAVVGARGNAVTGIEGEGANCEVLQSVYESIPIVSNLLVYPVPTANLLQISWENVTGKEVSQLQITDPLGRELELEKNIPGFDQQKIDLDVSDFPNGLYNASLVANSGERQFFQFIVAHP